MEIDLSPLSVDCLLGESEIVFEACDESSSSLYSAQFSSASRSSFHSDIDLPPLISPPVCDAGPTSSLSRYLALVEGSGPIVVQPDPRLSHLGHLQVGQPVASRGSRRFYDNVNILEGIGFLRRGASTDLNGERYRFVTWYGERYMASDFRRLYDEGERLGLVRAVELFKAGVSPPPDSFTDALDINHDDAGAGVYSRGGPGRSRGKCPIKVAAQRLLVILMAARGRLASLDIAHLLLLPYDGVDLKRRYFCVRDILVTFGVVEASKRRRREHCLQYCGPAPRPILRSLLIDEEEDSAVVPLCIVDEAHNLLPLFTADREPVLEPPPSPPSPPPLPPPEEEEEEEEEAPLEPRPHIDILPVSLFDDFDSAALSAEVFAEKVEDWGVEDMLLHTNSDSSSRLARTDTMLPWLTSN